MFEGKWEQRWDPLREEWVVYAAHRNQRPWNSVIPDIKSVEAPIYLPDCYLCPGNGRVSGSINPDYAGVFVFENDHPVVGLNAPEIKGTDSIYKTSAAKGIAKVICFHPNHSYHWADLDPSQIAKIMIEIRDQIGSLATNPIVKSVLLFENRGALCGVSNPHPHAQIYATNFTFKNTERHLIAAEKYKSQNGKNLFQSILEQELKDKSRIIFEDEHCLAIIPYFARYAYEVLLFPSTKHNDIRTLNNLELLNLGLGIQRLVKAYDALFMEPFPYVMTFMQAPLDNQYDEYYFHIHFQPPLRTQGLQKFLAGPEIGAGNFMADTLPEMKASELRAKL